MSNEGPVPNQRRRSPRQGIRVPMELLVEGRPVRVETRVVSETGALVVCPRRLPLGLQLEVLNLRSRRRAHARVAWLGPGDTKSDWRLGLELSDAAAGFWGPSYALTRPSRGH
jgi:hypothetical protein